MSDTPITDSYQNCYDGRFLEAMEKLERENAALRAQVMELKQDGICRRREIPNKEESARIKNLTEAGDKLFKETVALRALISEPYGFFTFGHKALQPWGKALDNWCNRAKPLLENKEAKP